jgi:hypothetical protein
LASLAGAAGCCIQPLGLSRQKPTLDHLCQLSYQLKLPLLTLFTGVPAQWRGPERPQAQVDSRGMCWAEPVIERSELRRILTEYLREIHLPAPLDWPPLGFHSAETINLRGLDRSRRMVARQRDSGTAVASSGRFLGAPKDIASKRSCTTIWRTKARCQFMKSLPSWDTKLLMPLGTISGTVSRDHRQTPGIRNNYGPSSTRRSHISPRSCDIDLRPILSRTGSGSLK